MSLPETRITEYKCSQCDYLMDHALGVDDEAIPTEGDLSLCLSCGHAMVFTAGLEGVREVPAEEWELIKREYPESWAMVQRARALIREQRRKGNWVE